MLIDLVLHALVTIAQVRVRHVPAIELGDDLILLTKLVLGEHKLLPVMVNLNTHIVVGTNRHHIRTNGSVKVKVLLCQGSHVGVERVRSIVNAILDSSAALPIIALVSLLAIEYVVGTSMEELLETFVV